MCLLSGRTAVVTGGASGIGWAIAQTFLDQGASVCIVDLDEKRGKALEAEKDRLLFVRGDVTAKGLLRDVLVRAVARFGPVSIWVNNAGVALNEQEHMAWRKMIEINLCAVIEGTQIALDYAEKHCPDAIVVNVASMAGLRPAPLAPVYSATKSGVVYYSRSTAKRLGEGSKTRVVCVCPVFTDTTLIRKYGDAVVDIMRDSQAGTLLSTDDVAFGVLELVAGLKPCSVSSSAGAAGAPRESVRNGGVMRVMVREGKMIRDMFEYPLALGGLGAKKFEKMSKL